MFGYQKRSDLVRMGGLLEVLVQQIAVSNKPPETNIIQERSEIKIPTREPKCILMRAGIEGRATERHCCWFVRAPKCARYGDLHIGRQC